MFTGMFITKETLSRISNYFHMPVHAFIGAVLGYIFIYFQPEYGVIPALLFGAAGAVIPDADHLLYIFTYGRKTDYSKVLRSHLKNVKLREFKNFVMDNHKYNTGVYSHNLLTVLIAVIFFCYFAFIQDNYGAAIFTLGMISHYSYDIFEDWLLLGRINPNWFLLFKREKIDPPYAIKKIISFAKLVRFFPNAISSFPVLYGYLIANDFSLSLKSFGFIVLALFLFSPMFYGAIYIMDDIKDLETDRLHPVKSKGRAIASGEISLPVARRTLKILLFFSLIFAFLLSEKLFGLMAVFLITNLLYLFVIREMEIVNMFFATILHTLKLVMGIVIANVNPTVFYPLIITDFLAYLSVVAGKRTRQFREGYVPSKHSADFYGNLSVFQYIVYFISLAYLIKSADAPGLFYRVLISVVALSLTVLYKPKTAMRSFVDFMSYGDDREGTFTRLSNVKLWKR